MSGAPKAADLAEAATARVVGELWNAIRALEAVERIAGDIAAMTSGDINAQAEGIAGIVMVVTSHIRRQQIALGGDE